MTKNGLPVKFYFPNKKESAGFISYCEMERHEILDFGAAEENRSDDMNRFYIKVDVGSDSWEPQIALKAMEFFSGKQQEVTGSNNKCAVGTTALSEKILGAEKRAETQRTQRAKLKEIER